MNTPIRRYVEVAGPFLELLPLNSCIEQTRIFKECMEPFGVKIEPLQVMLIVACEAFTFVAGHDPGVGVGHVIAIACITQETGVREYWLVDPTISQASVPERGIVIPRNIVSVGPLDFEPQPGQALGIEWPLPSGVTIDVEWRLTDRRDFEATEAWEPSHLWPMIHRIVDLMRASAPGGSD